MPDTLTVAFLMANSGVQQEQSCPVNGWTLITSRHPDDVSAFGAVVVETLSR